MPTVKTSRRMGTDRDETGEAIKEAAAIATADEPLRPTVAEKMVTIRLTDFEYNELKAAYAKQGVKLATGIKMAALWLLQSGATVTRAGVIDRRG